MLVTLTACSHIEDTNGEDDYSVVTFSDEDIIGGRGNTTTVGVIETNSYLNDKLKGTYKVSKLSGIIEIAEFDSKKKKINFDIELTCESGNVLIAIVSDGEIVRKIEANQEVNFEVSNNKEEYRILIIGESAKASVKYQVKGYN
jgi:hypothetical protein